jgi:hypothetical protein
VPLAWVKTVRNQAFGPEGSNEEIEQARTEALAACAEGKKILTAAQTFRAELEAFLGAKQEAYNRAADFWAKLMPQLEPIARRLEKIEARLHTIEGAVK